MIFDAIATMSVNGWDFWGRVIHGSKPKAGFKEMRQRLEEKVDFDSAIAD
jgi:hypothetical protein